MHWREIYRDFPSKLAFCFLIFAVVILLSYQLYWAFVPLQAPFLEPDSLEYLLFVQLAISHHSLAVSNPYLVYPLTGFFESAGLYQVPLFLHYFLPFLPLVWDFRIIYGLGIVVLYAIPLLILKRILNNTPLSNTYRYASYALVLLQFLLLQQSELVEWRGSLFIIAFQLLMFWVISTAFLDWKSWGNTKKVLAIISIPILLWASSYMWSGWWINLVVLGLIPLYLLYGRFRGRMLYRVGAGAIIVLAISVSLFSPYYIQAIVYLLHSNTSLGGIGIVGQWCLYNPLQIGEVQCLSPSNGLYAVCIDLCFFAFAIWTFLGDSVFAQAKSRYEYFLVGGIFLALLDLPMALVYLRMIQLLAPYLAVGFALGVVAFLLKSAKSGANKIVMSVVIFGILTSSVISFALFWSSTSVLYQLDNPAGLINASAYLNAHGRNSSVLSFYAYGDALEEIGHVRTYADTIQGLNNNHIGPMNAFFTSVPVNCSYLFSLNPVPDYVLATNALTAFTLFDNASNSSIVRSPLLVEQCGYSPVWNGSGFYLLKKG